jgi:hypothetical protein
LPCETFHDQRILSPYLTNIPFHQYPPLQPPLVHIQFSICLPSYFTSSTQDLMIYAHEYTPFFGTLKESKPCRSEMMPASWSPYHPTYHPSSTLAKNPLLTQPPFTNLQTQETLCEASQSSATLICCDCIMPTYSTV